MAYPWRIQLILNEWPIEVCSLSAKAARRIGIPACTQIIIHARILSDAGIPGKAKNA